MPRTQGLPLQPSGRQAKLKPELIGTIEADAALLHQDVRIALNDLPGSIAVLANEIPHNIPWESSTVEQTQEIDCRGLDVAISLEPT